MSVCVEVDRLVNLLASVCIDQTTDGCCGVDTADSPNPDTVTEADTEATQLRREKLLVFFNFTCLANPVSFCPHRPELVGWPSADAGSGGKRPARRL